MECFGNAVFLKTVSFREYSKKKERYNYMKRKSIAGILTAVIMSATMCMPITVFAAEKFDPAFYAATYPDVVNALGTDANALYNHYITYGKSEGRVPYAGAVGGATVDGIANTTAVAPATTTTTASTVDGIVPIDKLANYKSLKKSMTDEEFQAAYNEALKIVQPLVGKDWNTQMVELETALRARFDVAVYSTSAPHYNDPYGYLILGTASCAGCTRTTGLCLNMLGYSYEHVNENKWDHQWCRIHIGVEFSGLQDIYWICDPFADYSGPEFMPYQHPMLIMAEFGMANMYTP